MSERIERPLSAADNGEPFLRGLTGAVALLLVARACEPLFFGDGYFATLAIHPFWIVVILAAMQGGFFVGVATAAAAAMLVDWPPRPAGVDITAHYVELAIVPVQWLLAAIIIGTIRQNQIRHVSKLIYENQRLRGISEDLAEEIERIDFEIAELELQVATSEIRYHETDDTDSDESGSVRAHEPGLVSLSTLTVDSADASEARFAEATPELNNSGATLHAPEIWRERVGAAPIFSGKQNEDCPLDAVCPRLVEAEALFGTQVVAGASEDRELETLTSSELCEEPAVPECSSIDESARAPSLAAAIGFSGFRSASYLGGAKRRQSSQ